MPFYEYVCTSCGASVEVLQKVSDPPETVCPECHAEALTKQISAAGFRLKGGGWYETDFKSKGQRNVAGGAEGAPADAAKDGAAASGHGCAAGACGCAPKSAAPASDSSSSSTSSTATPPATAT
ncbi:MAG: zinc ribbon domain-containing protein [Nevskia sp.]|nr:zinc ribbon domain-containing protein [Nevskia sp.]